MRLASLVGALLLVAVPAIHAQGYPNKPIRMVPVGDVLYELDKRMEQGQVPGYTDIIELYSDGIHFTNAGSYIVGLTFFTTLYKDDPNGLPVPTQYGTSITAPQAAAFQDVDPLLFLPMRVIGKRLLARRDACQVDAGAPQPGRLAHLIASDLRARAPRMGKRLRARGDICGPQ